MKKILPLILILTGCTAMFVDKAPQAPAATKGNSECLMKCQDIYGNCLSGMPKVGSVSKTTHYNLCNDVLQDCYDICVNTH